MKSMKIVFALCFSSGVAFPLFAGSFTVAKDGSGDYSTIQAAIRAAAPGDTVKILDTAVYPEQVTIDSTKNNLALLSANPTSLDKPKIIWTDTVNIGPKTYKESQTDSLITFHGNGALRILGCRNVTIDGLAINGGGWFVFGYPAVWGGKSDLEYGNAAVTIWQSGGVHLMDCDISHAYVGIYLSDFSIGGACAVPNPTDSTIKAVPFYQYALRGNHVIEADRIHNNSFGMYFEQMYDVGTTIRRNLFYENHHYADLFAASVKALTNEGRNQPGGAMIFKDNMLSPLAIYNNTFWRNSFLFVANYQPGFQHLLFNNVVAQPNRTWSHDPYFAMDTSLELSPYFPNRMNNCVFSFQTRPKDSSYCIMNKFPSMQGSFAQPPAPGCVISGSGSFPQTAGIRWVEMDSSKFMSTDPASEQFLEPDWDDTLVKQYIQHQGWQASGVRNSDGSWADLGAVSSTGGFAPDLAVIRPVLPVAVSGTTATLHFDIQQRTGTMQSPTLKLFRCVNNLNYVAGSFGTGSIDTKVVPVLNIGDLAAPASPLQTGMNDISVQIMATTTPYGFIEAIAEGTGSDGNPFATTVGFLPYSKDMHALGVEIWNAGKTRMVDTVSPGQAVSLHIATSVSDTGVRIQPMNIWLESANDLADAASPAAPQPQLTLSGGFISSVDQEILFTKPSGRNFDYVLVSGKVGNVGLLGASKGIVVIPPATGNPVPRTVTAIRGTRQVTFSIYDLRGRKVLSRTLTAVSGFAGADQLSTRRETGLSPNVYLLQITERNTSASPAITKIQKIVVR